MKIIQSAIFIVLIIAISGCFRGRPSENPPIHLNPNMDYQEKYETFEESDFFADGSAMRMPVEGTVARGELRADTQYYTGKDEQGNFIAKSPLQFTMPVLQRGQQRYDIYCAPCHDGAGTGQGIVIKKGFLLPPSFHLDRLREAPDGHFYDVISNGIRNMPSYRHQVPVEDRWAIVGYVRALQRSQSASSGDVPADVLKDIK